MYYRSTAATTADGAVVPTSGSRSVARGLAGAAVFAGLTVLGANIYIPLLPVPVTLQTLFVLLAGATIGARYGALSQVFYVGLGAAGLPVFAGHLGGWGVLAGPTGGYLLSFLIVPLLIGRLMERSNKIRWQVLVFAAGTAVVFVMGISHLAVFYTNDWPAAVRFGLLPFIPGAVFKVFAATSISRAYGALRHR